MDKFQIPEDSEILHDYPRGQYLSRGYIIRKLKLKTKAFFTMVHRGIFPSTKKRNLRKEPLYTMAQADAIIYAYRLCKRGKLPRSLIRACIDQQISKTEKNNEQISIS